MVSLKAEPKEILNCGPCEQPEYPYGTSLTLEGSVIDQLGLSDCTVGQAVKVEAMAKVTGVREENGRKSLTIQLTEMEVVKQGDGGQAPSPEANTVQTLYPPSGKWGA
jgi:hypothetical protein